MSAHRKVVTVLFCDVVGSTAVGEPGSWSDAAA
jgi:class 3 adenylate cyclase